MLVQRTPENWPRSISESLLHNAFRGWFPHNKNARLSTNTHNTDFNTAHTELSHADTKILAWYLVHNTPAGKPELKDLLNHARASFRSTFPSTDAQNAIFETVSEIDDNTLYVVVGTRAIFAHTITANHTAEKSAASVLKHAQKRATAAKQTGAPPR